MAKAKKNQSAVQAPKNAKLTDFFCYSSQASSSQLCNSSPPRPSQNFLSQSRGQDSHLPLDESENALPRNNRFSDQCLESTHEKPVNRKSYSPGKSLQPEPVAQGKKLPLSSISVQGSPRAGKAIVSRYLSVDSDVQPHQRRRSPRLEELALTARERSPNVENMKTEGLDSPRPFPRRRSVKRKFMDDSVDIAKASQLGVIVVDNSSFKQRKSQVRVVSLCSLRGLHYSDIFERSRLHLKRRS